MPDLEFDDEPPPADDPISWPDAALIIALVSAAGWALWCGIMRYPLEMWLP